MEQDVKDKNIIFSGLCLHSLDIAVEHLPEYCDEVGAFYIAQQIPGLIEDYGDMVVRSIFRSVLSNLDAVMRNEKVKEVFTDGIRTCGGTLLRGQYVIVPVEFAKKLEESAQI